MPNSDDDDKVFGSPNFPKGKEDPYGVGMNADGTLNVLTPEQARQAILERNAYEALDIDDGKISDEELEAIKKELAEDSDAD